MSLSDIDNVSIGFILDLIEENNKEYEEANEPQEATPEDIKRFFK